MNYTITYQHRTDLMHTMTIRAESKDQAIRRFRLLHPDCRVLSINDTPIDVMIRTY